MRLGRLLVAVLGVGLSGGLAYAGSDPTPARGASPEVPVSSLVLTIRARALGLETVAIPGSSDSLGLDAVKASTGAGATRMPSATTEIARGVYLTVMPSCVPGVDEFGARPSVRRPAVQPLRSRR